MTRALCLPTALALALVACTPSEVSAPHDPAATWEPVDEAFEGCRGACGAHADGPSPGVVVQPGAALGDTTYCPVSGAVFRIEETHPHASVGDHELWFCCAGCATYFEAHRTEVLRARGMEGS